MVKDSLNIAFFQSPYRVLDGLLPYFMDSLKTSPTEVRTVSYLGVHSRPSTRLRASISPVPATLYPSSEPSDSPCRHLPSIER